jgi:hypothetical protein
METLYQLESVFKDVFIAFLPLAVFFIIFQFIFLKLSKKAFIRLLKSIGVSFVGMVLFIQGVNMSFLASGEWLGNHLALHTSKVMVVFIGFILGFLVTFAEPAVKVLNIEVEKETSGYINAIVLQIFLSVGVGLAVSIALIRMIFDINFMWIILPIYLIAILLMKFVSATFTAIAFDAGGVVTGPMIATFIMAFTLSAAYVYSDTPISMGFGMIALVAVVPIITILILGLLYHDES